MKSEHKIKSKRAIEIQNSISQVLFRDWDPINVNDNVYLVDKYNAYTAPTYKILIENRSQDEIMKSLFSAEKQILGDAIKTLETVAKKLLMLDVKFN